MSAALKETRWVDGERRRTRSEDPETALEQQLRSIVDKLDIDVLVVADREGAPLASAGDANAAINLAQLAIALIKDLPMSRGVTTTRGFVHVDRVQVGLFEVVVAAMTCHGVPDPIGVARAVGGVGRILRDGLRLDAAPLPLVVRGGWGDWGDVP